MGKKREKILSGVFGTAALCGVFMSGGVDGGALKRLEIEDAKKVKKRDAERATREEESEKGRFGGNEAILAAPRTERRLSVRELRPGDVLAARWGDEKKNGTPGFWNHLAIVGADGTRVVEAQKSADGIVTAAISDFLARYSDVCVFRFFDSETARRAAEWAESRVAVATILTSPLPLMQERNAEVGGDWNDREEESNDNGCADWKSGEKKGEKEKGKTRLSGPRYSWSASLAPTLRENAATENCVSLVRRAFGKASGVDYRWKTPDDLARWDKTGCFAQIGRF